MALLHVLRTDLSPVSDRLSEYANGSYGFVMAAAFFSLGGGMVALGAGIFVAGTTSGWARLVPVALIGAGAGMFLSGLYPTEPTGAQTSTEAVHSIASGAATMAVIGAAVLSFVLARTGSPRSAVGPAGVLAAAALVLGTVSPALHGSRWTGLSQRLLWLTLLLWLLATAWRLSPTPAPPGALQRRR